MMIMMKMMQYSSTTSSALNKDKNNNNNNNNNSNNSSRCSSRRRRRRGTSSSSVSLWHPTLPSHRSAQRVRARAAAADDSTLTTTLKASTASTTTTRESAIKKENTKEEEEENKYDCGKWDAKWDAREFTQEGRVFTETFPIRFDEVGPNKLADMGTMARISQECACNHAQGLWGRSQSMPEDMRKVDMAWVCTRLHLDIDEYPKWGDQVMVKTWFESQGRVAARRDWDLVNNETNKRIGKATSQWIAFNLKTRRMGRIPSQVVEDFELQQWLAEPVMGKDYEVEKLPDAREIGQMEGSECSLPVVHYTRRSDLDMNGHVNNCIYTEWLLESVPKSYWQEYELKELVIEFKAECNFGDIIEAVCCEDVTATATADGKSNMPSEKTALAHSLLKQKDGKQTEVVRARTIWLLKKERPDEQ